MKYYKRINELGETTTVESYSHDVKPEGTIEISKAEFDLFICQLPEAPPAPRINSFLLAVLNLFGIVDGNALLAKYPLFVTALNAQNWIVTLQTLQYAQASGDITAEQYRQIVDVLAPEYAIPFTQGG